MHKLLESLVATSGLKINGLDVSQLYAGRGGCRYEGRFTIPSLSPIDSKTRLSAFGLIINLSRLIPLLICIYLGTELC